jgi:hypothetical protein
LRTVFRDTFRSRAMQSGPTEKARVGDSHNDDGQSATHHEDNEYGSIQKSLSGFDGRFNDAVAFFVHGRLLSEDNRTNGVKVPNHRQSRPAAHRYVIAAPCRRRSSRRIRFPRPTPV